MNKYSIDDLEIGMKESLSVYISEELVEEFSNISGDKSSIHTDVAFAQKKGFEGRVVYGMVSTLFFSTIVGMYLPGENGLLQSILCDYLRPVYIGENLTIMAEIDGIHKSVGQISLKVDVINEKQEKVVKGKIKALVI